MKKYNMQKVKTIILFFFFTLFLGQSLFSQLIEVGNSAEISLITCMPGDKMYEKFGHTAIRYKDDSAKADMVFNYGLFNFNQKHFYINFIKGRTYYQLGAYDTHYFLEDYKDRLLIEQKLDLTHEEKQQLMDWLMINWLPENRSYLYNFIYNNCSTEPRNKIYNLFINKRFKFNYIAKEYTFREWIEKYTGKDSWIKFGIDLTFGKDADNKASKWESMFIPENLQKELSGTIIYCDSTEKKLVKKEKILINPSKTSNIASGLVIKPIYVTSFILFIVALFTIIGFFTKRLFRFVDFILFITTGIAGLILFYLIFFSIHPLVVWNFNILWCNPLNVLFAILIWTKSMKEANRFFFSINLFLQIVFLGIWITSFQVINIAFIPIVIAFLLRSVLWISSKRWYKSRRRYRMEDVI